MKGGVNTEISFIKKNKPALPLSFQSMTETLRIGTSGDSHYKSPHLFFHRGLAKTISQDEVRQRK